MIGSNLKEIREQTNWCQEILQGSLAKIEVVDIGQIAIKCADDLDRYFTPEEVRYCQERGIPSIAGHIAAKESIAEILGQGENIPWQNIAIGHLHSGQPIVYLRDQALSFAIEKSINRIAISMSHGIELAVAFTIGLGQKTPNLHIGTDVSSVDGITGQDARFFKRVYTQGEIDEANGNITRFAEQWAVKEAVSKALGTGMWKEGVVWTDIVVHIANNGSLSVGLTGGALQRAQKMDINEWSVCIIRSQSNPIAFVIGAQERT